MIIIGHYRDGWGRLALTNAAHFPWLVAVDPRGTGNSGTQLLFWQAEQ
ncbi:MAG: hypothetical protein AB8B64_10720 [Granulosicoccus sp.]